jgi:hypothetical protein
MGRERGRRGALLKEESREWKGERLEIRDIISYVINC